MKQRKIPQRRCVGCVQSKPKKELIRIVAVEEGGLKIDLTGKANGRGVYLCPDPACLALARKKKAIGRNLKIETTEADLDRLFEELKGYAEDAGKDR